MAQNDIINQYLASGGTQADVDAYLGAHPDADVNQMASDAAAWAAPQGDAFGGFAPNVDNAPGGRGSLGGALSSGDDNYRNVFLDPNRRRAEQTAGEFAAMGYSPYGMEEKWSPTPDVKAEALTRQKEGQWRAIVNNEGTVTPERKAQFEADWAKIHPAAPPASGGGSGGIGPTGQPFTWGGGGGAGGGGADYGGGANYGGGGAGSLLGGYELPDSAAASQAMRDLQMGGLKGLQGLMSADTEAQRAQMQKALYKTSKRGINTAADRARQTMLEGTFGRGVGSSSILVELAGRQQQEHSDALAQAARDAYTGAGAEQRANLAAQLGLNTAGFNAATSGLQGEANVALANLARMQQESQFGRNLGFQGSENALNRAQAASQFGQNLGLQQSQLAQQASQFGQNLGFQGTQNQLNRDAAAAAQQLANQQAFGILGQQQQFAGGENAANRALQTYLQQSGQDFAGAQSQAQRDLTRYLQESGQQFTGTQNDAQRAMQAYLQQSGQDFSGTQNEAQRALAQSLQTGSQTFQGGQNELQRQQQMQQFLLSLAQNEELASNRQAGTMVGAGMSGLTTLAGPLLAQLAKNWGTS
jgi:hypothetical protein